MTGLLLTRLLANTNWSLITFSIPSLVDCNGFGRARQIRLKVQSTWVYECTSMPVRPHEWWLDNFLCTVGRGITFKCVCVEGKCANLYNQSVGCQFSALKKLRFTSLIAYLFSLMSCWQKPAADSEKYIHVQVAVLVYLWVLTERQQPQSQNNKYLVWPVFLRA